MARIKLAVDQWHNRDLFPRSFLDEQGQVRLVPWLRLEVGIAVGPEPYAATGPLRRDSPLDQRLIFPAILDTGAALTIFPRRGAEARAAAVADHPPRSP